MEMFVVGIGFVMVFVPKTHTKTDEGFNIVAQGKTLGYNDATPLGLYSYIISFLL